MLWLQCGQIEIFFQLATSWLFGQLGISPPIYNQHHGVTPGDWFLLFGDIAKLSPSQPANCQQVGMGNWHDCAVFQRSAFRRSTAGNDIVVTIFISLFPFFSLPPLPFFSPFLSPLSRPFLIEWVLGSKNLFSESWKERQKPRDKHLSRPCLPFWGPLAAILDFAGDVALQVVSECPLHLDSLHFWRGGGCKNSLF